MILSLYLVSYVSGRYAFGRLSEKIAHIDLALGGAAIAIPLSAYAFVMASGYELLIFLFLIGFLVSGIFPNILALGTDIFPEHSGPINALATGAASLGISIIPTAIGVLSDIYSIESAMRVIIFLAVGVTVFTLIVKRLHVNDLSSKSFF